VPEAESRTEWRDERGGGRKASPGCERAEGERGWKPGGGREGGGEGGEGEEREGGGHGYGLLGRSLELLVPVPLVVYLIWAYEKNSSKADEYAFTPSTQEHGGVHESTAAVLSKFRI
jgi:hypothetical protein